jgi:hypothetical protein
MKRNISKYFITEKSVDIKNNIINVQEK